jgi:hypothetical protein
MSFAGSALCSFLLSIWFLFDFLCLGAAFWAAALRGGGLATAALLGVGKNLLLHYGRLRCAFLGVS